MRAGLARGAGYALYTRYARRASELGQGQLGECVGAMLCPPKTNNCEGGWESAVQPFVSVGLRHNTTIVSRVGGGRQWVGGCAHARTELGMAAGGWDVVDRDSLTRAADVARACRGGQNRKQGILPTSVHYGLPNQAQAAVGGRDGSARIGQAGPGKDADPPRGIMVAGGKSIAGGLTRRARRTTPFPKSSSLPIVNSLASLSIQLGRRCPPDVAALATPCPISLGPRQPPMLCTVSDSRTARRPCTCTAAAHPGLRLFTGLLRRRPPLSLERTDCPFRPTLRPSSGPSRLGAHHRPN